MGKLKLLIVEDNKVTLKLYDSAIKEQIFEKRIAKNGAEATRIYEGWTPDIILLDLMLHEKSGYNVLKEIRDGQRDLSTTIIIASILSNRDDIVQCAKHGIQGYLVKPIDPGELDKTILKLYGDSSPTKAAQIIPFMQDI